MKCNFVKTVFDKSQSYLDKTAFRDGYEDLTYAQLITRTRQTAQGLLAEGLVAGDHVILTMEDCVDWPVIFLACVYTGIVPLPLSTVVGEDLFWQIAEFIECKKIIAGNSNFEKINQKSKVKVISRQDVQQFYQQFDGNIDPLPVHPDSACYMNVSSGSTGMPKVAVHRHQVLYEILKLSPELSFSMTKDSVILSIAKMSWNFGLQNSITYTVGLGATAIVIPDPPAAPVVFDYINRFTPTIVVTSPSIIRRLLLTNPSKYLLPNSIQHFHSSGEHLPEPMYDQFLDRFGIKLNSCIGMMETCTNYAANPDFEHDKGTVGKPLPGCKVKLIDSNGNECVGSDIGEIYVSSPASAFYYYKNYNKTKETFCGEWVKTGDLAYWNKNKNLVFVGRVDDVFKVNDLIVSPVEIESVILKNTTVDQVAVTGVKNSKGITEVHAFVVANDNFNLDQFKEFLSKTLFPHQYPKQIHQVKQLPETMTNKKDRKTMSKMVINVN